MCQKASGAPFVTLAEIALSEFNWTRGAPAHFASSSRAVREFCRACGTPLAYRQPAGSSIELMCGTFDRPGDITPTYQVGIESQLSWVAHIAALPGRTSGAAMAGTAADRLVSHQHPDHDTSAA